MKTVKVGLGVRSYEIIIGPGLLDDRETFQPWIAGAEVFIVTNEIVAPWYLQKVRKALSGKTVHQMVLPDGEQTKNLETATRIFDRMLGIPLSRAATVIALGGGVVGDMAGFVAACYQRGIPFIQVPTTLLAQVDSSVGGKTAVNHPLGKNMIGIFHQPKRVIADVATLVTLDPREYSSGMAEAIKYGMINDPDFFSWLEENMERIMAREADALEYCIEKSCKNKAAIVEQDEQESGVRALLNLGHTFGHAIETATGYGTWLHGEAVALGMVMAAHMSVRMGLLATEDMNRVTALLQRAGLPVDSKTRLCPDELKAAMKTDKKVKDGRIRLVLLRGIGQAFVSSQYPESVFNDTLQHYASGRA
ncbi:MAG: 3-dehydroquinate synthase [Gammaproteobacteria bacterium]|nr:3-dehydroquinate synthase [Gammaproteobacteria bacterium]